MSPAGPSSWLYRVVRRRPPLALDTTAEARIAHDYPVNAGTYDGCWPDIAEVRGRERIQFLIIGPDLDA